MVSLDRIHGKKFMHLFRAIINGQVQILFPHGITLRLLPKQVWLRPSLTVPMDEERGGMHMALQQHWFKARTESYIKEEDA